MIITRRVSCCAPVITTAQSCGDGGRVPCVSPGRIRSGTPGPSPVLRLGPCLPTRVSTWQSATRGLRTLSLQATPKGHPAYAHAEAKLRLFPLPTGFVGSPMWPWLMCRWSLGHGWYHGAQVACFVPGPARAQPRCAVPVTGAVTRAQSHGE